MVNYKHKGGRVTMPSEFYGNNSNSYGSNPNAGFEPFAYGQPVAVSQGVIHNGQAGPNLGVFPLSSLIPTGGARKRNSNKKRQSSKKQSSKRQSSKRHSGKRQSGKRQHVRKSLKSRRRRR